MVKNILLTGLPRAGKTTVVLKVAEGIKGRCAGFYTEEILKKGKRVGFRLITLNGSSGILAHREIKSQYNVGKYGVDIESLEKLGIKAVKEGIEGNKVIIIDEIGKMELFSIKFRTAVIEALDSRQLVLATIMSHSHPFCDGIKSRKDVKMFEVTPKNRDSLPGIILNMITGSLGD